MSVYSSADRSSISGVMRCGMIKTWPGTMGRKLTKAALNEVRAKMLALGIKKFAKPHVTRGVGGVRRCCEFGGSCRICGRRMWIGHGKGRGKGHKQKYPNEVTL